MAKRKKRLAKKKAAFKTQLAFEFAGLSLLALTTITIAKLGAVGNFFVMIFRFIAGEWYILPLLGAFILSIYYIWKRKQPNFTSTRLLGIYIITCSILLSGHLSLFAKQQSWIDPSVIRNTMEFFMMEVRQEAQVDLGGGMIGAVLFACSQFLFSISGTQIIILLMIVVGVMLVSGKSFQELFGKILKPFYTFLKKQWTDINEERKSWKENRQARQAAKKERKEKERQEKEKEKENQETLSLEVSEHLENGEPIISDFQDLAYNNDTEQQLQLDPKPEVNEQQQKTKTDSTIDTKDNTKTVNEEVVTTVLAFSEHENEDYKLPSIDLLDKPKVNTQMHEKKHIHANARKLEKTFQSFGVKARVAKVHLGPAVTKYEVYPDIGVKVSKIVNLSDDLALALAAKDIRIEAPIPGKSAVGIEVPNQEIAMVSLREVLESPNNNHVSKLMFALGRDISGDAVMAELNKMPHLLVAGATGSGKSVCVNGIITSILMRAKPHEVKMMMIDPKMVELNVYNGIPHLLAPVVTDAKKASQALKKVVAEMERRYDLFSHTGTRNIEGYNDNIKRQNQENNEKQPTLPFIVVLIDELADLMMVASNDVEDSIARLAQMARAAGIHLIIATQRPSVDVITGVIKANIPSRIAFSVSSQTDSRTILDMGGADKLLGRGDMLFLPVGASKPVRVQGAFLSDEEVEKVVDFCIAQQKAQYQEEMIPQETQTTETEVKDELFDDAVQLVTEMQTASVSMLQRRFRIGYTRAARLIDAMEDRGIVGPYEGSKPREVLISKSPEEASS